MPMYRYAAATPTVEEELTEAVHRVVNHYGSDLTAYFRHVEEVAKKNAQESGASVDSANDGDAKSHS